MSRLVTTCVLAVAFSGCSGGLEQFPTAAAKGRVMCQGKPVPNARVIFAPLKTGKSTEVGKAGFGDVQADGTFSLRTYTDDDGAVVGKHSVTVISPHPEDFPDFKCDCETNSRKVVTEVEVTADGENDFTINLPVATARSQPNVDPEDAEDARAAKAAQTTAQLQN
jgi:hypothetical protein